MSSDVSFWLTFFFALSLELYDQKCLSHRWSTAICSVVFVLFTFQNSGFCDEFIFQLPSIMPSSFPKVRFKSKNSDNQEELDEFEATFADFLDNIHENRGLPPAESISFIDGSEEVVYLPSKTKIACMNCLKKK